MVSTTPPQVLYEVPNITVYHLQGGHETCLNDYPAPLTLLMVSTTTVDPFAEDPVEEEDFYLHVQQLPNLDLPLPATTKIFRQFPHSYLIPRLDLDGGRGSTFTRIEFRQDRNQDDVDTFETILAQCTAFLENAPAPQVERAKSPASGSSSAYNTPSEYYSSSSGYPLDKKKKSSTAKSRDMGGAGGYVPGAGALAGSEYNYGGLPNAEPTYNPQTLTLNDPNQQQGGRLVLVDEQDGRIVGELSQGFNVVEQVEPGSKAPVEVSLPSNPNSNELIIKPVEAINHDDIFSAAEHPAYKGSTIVSKAAWASKFIVTAATYAATAMESGATKFTQKTQPVAAPLTFTTATHDRVRKIHTFTRGASGMSSKTIGKVQEVAQNVGARIAGRVDKDGNDTDRGPPSKPGLLNKSMIAFSTLADGIDAASKHLLHSGSNAATTVVGHRYGEEAKQMAYGLTSSVKNVGLVYVDAAGVSRRAVVKSVAKGMILGKVDGGGELVAVTPDGTHGNIVYPNQQNESQQGLLGPPGGYAPTNPYSRPTTPQPQYTPNAGGPPPTYNGYQQDNGNWGFQNRGGSPTQPRQDKPNSNWF